MTRDTLRLLGVCACFFFQAEDGIRDLTVTGVQTCALPISMTTNRLIAKFRDVCRRFAGAKDGNTVVVFALAFIPLMGLTGAAVDYARAQQLRTAMQDRKSTRLNSSHSQISYAVFCLKKKNC